jgi:hypothetical protein
MSGFPETIVSNFDLSGASREPKIKDLDPARSADPNASIKTEGSKNTDDLLSIFELPWDTLMREGTALASLFAFAYVIGYFYAYDITWFPFFTLTEHLVFALRAIPFAIVASVIFMVVVNYSVKCDESSYKRVQLFKQCFRWLRWVWICFLVVAGACLVAENCFALDLSLGVVACGVCYFSLNTEPRRRPIHFVYWGTNGFVICLMLGFATGSVWHFYHLTWWSDYLSPLARVQHVTLASTANVNSRTPVGHVVFSGSNGVLLYDVCLRRTRLLQLKDIEEIWECRGSDCKIECADLREAASIPTSGIPAWPSQAFSGLLPDRHPTPPTRVSSGS